MREATCKKCNTTKPVHDFYKSQYSRISGLGECAECTKTRVKANRLENLEYFRAYDRGRGARQSADYRRGYRSNNHPKYKAHCAVNNAVRDGKIEKPARCDDCDALSSRIHGHHDDYSKPLDVRWLCPSCHSAWHKENGEAANG